MTCSPSIEAPDLDQQLAQAKATLASAKANYDSRPHSPQGADSALVEQKQIAAAESADNASR